MNMTLAAWQLSYAFLQSSETPFALVHLALILLFYCQVMPPRHNLPRDETKKVATTARHPFDIQMANKTGQFVASSVSRKQ